MTEDPLVHKTVSMLRQARKVIELMHAERGEGFQEEPSLGDLVMVAQILSQTSASERVEASAKSLAEGTKIFTPERSSPEEPGPAEPGSPQGPPASPPVDVMVDWLEDHWVVHLGENFSWRNCSTFEELSKALLDAATLVSDFRLKGQVDDR